MQVINWRLCQFSQDFDYRVVRVEKMNETDELFKYTLDVEKVDKTTLKVNSESDLFIDLDNEWHVSDVSISQIETQ